MKQKVDILWLVEHIAREMDVACAVKALVEARYGLDITIRNMYHQAYETMQDYAPSVVVWPFFYFAKGALAVEDYVKTWPKATHFNLSWEELYYKALLKPKAPSDGFAKKKVIHHAWGNFYKEYLLEFGVPEDHIFVNGQPAYQLYREPYNCYYKHRDWLAERYGLDRLARWIFIPENYRWAFGSKINLFTRLGGDRDEMLGMQQFCIDSLKQILQWCNQVARHKKVAVIFRPRPATNSQLIADFFAQNVGEQAPRLHFIKEETVREWILASDLVISSFSTSLIEAAVAGKPVFMVEPVSLPDALYSDWYRHIPRLCTLAEFEQACLQENTIGGGQDLKTWAESEMLSNGDPIDHLASFVNGLVETQRQAKTKRRSPLFFRRSELLQKNYFNLAAHEMDVFTEEDVQKRVAAWREVLLPCSSVAVDNPIAATQ